MPDDNNLPNQTDLANKIAELSSQLEQAKAKITELEGATGGFKTANGQLTSKVTQLEADLAAARQTVEAQTGELTNWTTRFEQLNQAHTALTGEATLSKQQLQLYGLIAGDPKYHNLIGVVDALKTDADPAKQKEILEKMAQGLQGQANQMLESFRAGGTPPAGSGGKPATTLPNDPKAAFEEYQSLLSTGTPEAASRRAALYEIVVKAQLGDNAKQPN